MMIDHNNEILRRKYPDLECSQCGCVLAEYGRVKGWMLGTPTCPPCANVIKEASDSTETIIPRDLMASQALAQQTHDDRSFFTRDEAKTILMKAKHRAKSWVQNNRSYLEDVMKFGLASWAETVYGVTAIKSTDKWWDEVGSKMTRYG